MKVSFSIFKKIQALGGTHSEAVCVLLTWKKVNMFIPSSSILYMESTSRNGGKRYCGASNTAKKKLTQLPAVDMQKVQGSLWCYSNLSPILIQPSLDAQSLCTLHSDCAKKSTYANMWSLDGSLAGACWMSTAGSWSSFFCSVISLHWENLKFQSYQKYFCTKKNSSNLRNTIHCPQV